MGERRAQARLLRARRPRSQAQGANLYPCKPFMGEGWDGRDARKRGFRSRADSTPFALPDSRLRGNDGGLTGARIMSESGFAGFPVMEKRPIRAKSKS